MVKRLLSILLAAIMALSAAAICFTSAAAMLGDVDNDGEITAGDARLVLRASVALEEITPAFIGSADVDKNGYIESADARLILRASVKLEDLGNPITPTEPEPQTTDHTHQVEKWELFTRNEATGDTCHSGVCTICGQTVYEEHTIVTQVTRESTCTQAGEAVEKCSVCGAVLSTTVIPAEHNWEVVKGSEIPSTCIKEGSRNLQCTVCGQIKTESLPLAPHTPSGGNNCSVPQVCSVCGKELTIATGHVYADGAAITATKGIRCERCGKVGLPSFNELVNVLKDGTHKYTGFKYTESSAGEPKVSGFMKTLINMMTAMGQIKKEDVAELLSSDLGNEAYYSELIKNRKITEFNYNLVGEDVVSALLENDPKAVKTEFVKGVDFLSSLPNTFVNERNREEDLTAIKNAAIGDVIKVTVTFAPEKYADVAANGGSSPINRIDSEIPKAVEEFMAGAGNADLGGLASDTGDADDLGSILARSMKFDFDSTYGTTVTYYFDAVTNAPIAAVYDGSMLINFAMNIYIDDPELNPDKESGSIAVDSSTKITSYYFFDDYFNAN